MNILWWSVNNGVDAIEIFFIYHSSGCDSWNINMLSWRAHLDFANIFCHLFLYFPWSHHCQRLRSPLCFTFICFVPTHCILLHSLFVTALNLIHIISFIISIPHYFLFCILPLYFPTHCLISFSCILTFKYAPFYSVSDPLPFATFGTFCTRILDTTTL